MISARVAVGCSSTVGLLQTAASFVELNVLNINIAFMIGTRQQLALPMFSYVSVSGLVCTVLCKYFSYGLRYF